MTKADRQLRSNLARSNAAVLDEHTPNLGGGMLTSFYLAAAWGHENEGALLAFARLDHNAEHVLNNEAPCSGVEC